MADWTDAQVTRFVVTMAWVMALLLVAVGLSLFWRPILDYLAPRRQAAVPAALIVAGAAGGAVAGYPAMGMLAGALLALAYLWRPGVSTFPAGGANDLVDYVKVGAVPLPASVASRQEAEAEAGREAAPEANSAVLHISEKDLQARLDRTYDRAAVEVFAALLKAGHLESAVKARKLSEAKQLIFGVSGGRQLQALNAAIDAVELPAPEPAPPRLVAISGGRGGYIDLDEDDPPEPLP